MRRPQPPGAGPLDLDAVGRTADTIAAAQEPSGQIPWFPGGHTDPWDHIEAAMALDVAGRHDRARAAYEWLRRSQNPDGSWYRGYRGAEVIDPVRESNFTAYVCVGLRHHLLSTGDDAFLDRMWPAVRAAVDFVLALRAPGGQIVWARDAAGAAADEALLTGCSSIYHALRCALELAGRRAEPQPGWELTASRLGHAVAAHPERFSPRERYAMDWYYPVLSGAVRGAAARARIDAGWDRFVVPGLGVRCVSDRPWVTGAETCELVLALCALGERDRAAGLFADVARLRHPDGSYWTGYVYPDRTLWPAERTTWTAGAVLLAHAALAGQPATSAVFDAARLPAGVRGRAARIRVDPATDRRPAQHA
ncbi:prenyltransferase [Solwaraspora sp. WMMD1047]|uniref:prenyltransferase n=1 Tax=Solwaraspora sp. WMMD1047 TaxID=3016102 RepID=UPI002417B23A|nr:prenyltransferase [Solwaraspora sp. WMMD1047]MDG4830132.1 prenyltransferase [Solwaraspora sp. WMMD1047]